MALEEIITINLTLIFVPVYLALIVVETIAVKKFGATGTVDLKDSGVCVFMGLARVVRKGMVSSLSLIVWFWAARFNLPRYWQRGGHYRHV